MRPIQLFDPDSSTYTYVLFDVDTRDALIIDPVDQQLDRDLAVLKEYGLRLVWTVETHAHADHITSAGKLAEHAGARTAAPAACGITTASRQLHDGDELVFGGQKIRALATPGHTAGSMCFTWEADGQRHVFTGDTLLINGCGRTDFQSGSPEAMYHSLTQVLFKLPDDTIVWPGHDYQGRTHSTIGHEKQHNARVAGKTLEEFVALMNSLNLPKPKRIDEAVPANLTSGLRHDADGALLQHPRPASGYAGDVSPQLAWQWVQAGEAVLVDVRTDAEREWVGFVPGAVPLAWKQWPGMVPNPDFDAGIQALAAQGRKLVMLCRSGARSIAAAKRATELGLEAYNILEGFEGDPDGQAHRGNKGGWRFHGLPWRQN
ncbi:glyoxylase-like metal-dependent hydrolase (beta-lactamase superfamily II) [Tepidicella xavieri]|uniref:Glyoxylase-like metal-dependent hydrolase (Beta-lactamase superfamily II) n=1 Tax=Tepidicella xavieri TaxID=360241 RepID=A0A4R6U9J7_9BURK|nr:glyoxylase-like metal-dependent hydrolase (beta-lactamase superfamily II) [Tepidicella xavieri]